MELDILRAEISRLADKYFWLRHAFVEVEAGPDWDDYDERFIRQLPFALNTDDRLTNRRMIDWRPWCIGTGKRGYSVWIADGGTDAEAKAAISQYEALAEHVAEHVLFRPHWERKAQMHITDDSGRTNAPESLLDHLHAANDPKRVFSDGRRDVDGLALGVYELHCGVFQSAAACLADRELMRTADGKADGEKKSREFIPENELVLKLYKAKQDPKNEDRSEIELARELAEGKGIKPESLTRKLRDFKKTMDSPKK